jgi:hypothetical protein
VRQYCRSAQVERQLSDLGGQRREQFACVAAPVCAKQGAQPTPERQGIAARFNQEPESIGRVVPLLRGVEFFCEEEPIRIVLRSDQGEPRPRCLGCRSQVILAAQYACQRHVAIGRIRATFDEKPRSGASLLCPAEPPQHIHSLQCGGSAEGVLFRSNKAVQEG